MHLAHAPRQIGRALGLSAALILALLASARWVPRFVALVTPRLWNAKLASEVLWGRLEGADEKVGVSQFVAFVATMALVVAITASYAWLRTRAERMRPLRWPARVLDVAMAVVALVVTSRASAFEAKLAAAVLVVSTGTLLGYGGTAHEARPSTESARTGFVLVAEAIALGWGLWLTGPRSLGLAVPYACLAALAAACIRAGAARTERDARRSALAGAPLLLLPLVGLARDPSLAWVFGASCASLVAWVALGRKNRLLGTRSSDLLVVAAATALTLLLWLPYRFREFPTEDNQKHEAQHLGWIASEAFGKFLFADAGFFYGPLREYMLGIVAWAFGGLTIDHVRLAHIALNAFGAALFLGAGWIVSGRRVWLFLLWCYLLLTRSPLRFFLAYTNNINFGWADVARPATAAVVVLGAIHALEHVDERRQSLRGLVAWGIATGAATLYSQDSGIAAIGAVFFALLGDALLRRRGLTLRARLQRGARTIGAFLAGVASLLGMFVAVYVAFGRGRRLLDAWHFLAEVGSGTFGASVYPLSPNDFRSSESLFGGTDIYHGPRFDYVLPLALLVLGAAAMVSAIVYRGWSARTTRVAGVFLFACALFRYSLYRADMWHITGGAIAAYLLGIALIADATSIRVRLGGVRRSFSPTMVLFLGLSLYGILEQEDVGGLSERARRIVSGEERASQGPRVVNALPRAGDARISPHTVALVDYVREHTSRAEPIWVVTDFMTGGEIYFLADRRNATRYDVWSEAITHREFRLALEDIERDPPILIVGHGWKEYSPEITDYVNQNWRLIDKVDGIDVRRYEPKVGAAAAASAH